MKVTWRTEEETGETISPLRLCDAKDTENSRGQSPSLRRKQMGAYQKQERDERTRVFWELYCRLLVSKILKTR